MTPSDFFEYSTEIPMSYAETVLPEFDQEMANTRKVLERIPEDKLDWQPHPKSHTIGWNANHLASLPDWLVNTMAKSSLDIAPVGGPRFELPTFSTRKEILELFDRNVAAARRHSRQRRTKRWLGRGRCCRAGIPSSACPVPWWSGVLC